jgi:hypothetical protein
MSTLQQKTLGWLVKTKGRNICTRRKDIVYDSSPYPGIESLGFEWNSRQCAGKTV